MSHLVLIWGNLTISWVNSIDLSWLNPKKNHGDSWSIRPSWNANINLGRHLTGGTLHVLSHCHGLDGPFIDDLPAGPHIITCVDAEKLHINPI